MKLPSEDCTVRMCFFAVPESKYTLDKVDKKLIKIDVTPKKVTTHNKEKKHFVQRGIEGQFRAHNLRVLVTF